MFSVMAVLGLPPHSLWTSLSAVVAVLDLLLATLWDGLSAVVAILPTLCRAACQL